MTRTIAAVGLLLAVGCQALAWLLPFGGVTGNRVARGVGTFPRWQALALATEAPIRWLVTVPPRRLAAVDRDGSLIVFEVMAGGLRVTARYGAVASPDGPPVAVRLDHEHTGVVLVAPDGRLLVWSDGVLRGYDVGGPLSSLTFPVPVGVEGRASNDLLAVAQDGAVVLIGGLAAGGPRAVARLDARALRDGRITIADLDGDGMSEAVVLSDPTPRYSHGVLGERLEAASITVMRLRPYGLELRTRFTLPTPMVFEDRVAVLAAIAGSTQAGGTARPERARTGGGAGRPRPAGQRSGAPGRRAEPRCEQPLDTSAGRGRSVRRRRARGRRGGHASSGGRVDRVPPGGRTARRSGERGWLRLARDGLAQPGARRHRRPRR